MISKPIHLINIKLEEMFDSAMFWLYTTIQAIVFDATNFCYRISQLTQPTRPERFDQMNFVRQREESLQQIVSIPREESLPQIVSGIYYHNAILQNLSEQDTCFGSKDLIDRERKAVVSVWIYMMSVIAKDKCLSAVSVSCQQSFQQIHLRQAMKSGTLGTDSTEYLC